MKELTVAELANILNDLVDDGHGDAVIRYAAQPQWPFEYSVTADDQVNLIEGEGEVFYIAEGTQLGYLPGQVAEDLGWR